MGRAYFLIISILLSFTYSRCNVLWKEAAHLHPVHGLYVKPSIDGTTGDLYVAATENGGTKTQWLTDQPISFLPAATQLKPAVLPATSSLTKINAQEDKSNTKGIATPPMNYAYAIPFPGSEGGALTPYPYAFATLASTEGPSAPTCSEGAQAHYSAFQYFYPQMMSALARAMNTLQGGEAKESNVSTSSISPYWSQPYTYPYPYVMVDPSAWAQSQKEPSPTQAGTNSNEST